MAKEAKVLAGKVVAITGGARGIGLATARACAARGMRVAIGDLDEAEAKKSAETIPGAIGLPLDVTERSSFEAFVAATEDGLGPLDVLINNAGIMQLGAFVDEDDVTAHRQVDINVHGLMYGSKIALPKFIGRGSGHLVNIASNAGKAGFPGGATYCGTKHFVVGLSEAIRMETRNTGVEVSVVMPGIVNTELASGLPSARGVKNVEPEDVANEIIDALERPRFDVYVPRITGGINKVMGVLPRGTREGVIRAIKADQVLWSVDENARRNYELRASHSEPSLEGEDQKQLTES